MVIAHFNSNLYKFLLLIKLFLSLLDDDENDEDYNFVEDHLKNYTHYKYDRIPYEFSIPKKEIMDVMNDRDK